MEKIDENTSWEKVHKLAKAAQDAADEVEKGRIYLKPGEKPSKGSSVKRGPKGGMYYEPPPFLPLYSTTETKLKIKPSPKETPSPKEKPSVVSPEHKKYLDEYTNAIKDSDYSPYYMAKELMESVTDEELSDDMSLEDIVNALPDAIKRAGYDVRAFLREEIDTIKAK